MATARDKLISDWRERLAAAEAVDTTAESRPAWLARLQIRLYRFLLSLYGDAEWTTMPPRRAVPKSAADQQTGAVIFDSSAALPLAGKPPKSLGQIQAVLKSVVNAQSQAPPAGPLTGGLLPESWVTVALAAPKHWHRINYVAESLRRRGIESRLKLHGSRYVLEVHASDFEQGLQIARQPPPRPVQRQTAPQIASTKPGPLASYVMHVMVIAAVVGLFCGQLTLTWAHVVLLGLDQRAFRLGYDEPLLTVAFFVGWLLGAAAIIAGAVTLDRLLVVGRNLRLPRRMSAAEFFSGLGWRCLATGCFLGPLVGLLAVGIADRFGLNDDVAIFCLAWALTILAAGVIYISRSE